MFSILLASAEGARLPKRPKVKITGSRVDDGARRHKAPLRCNFVWGKLKAFKSPRVILRAEYQDHNKYKAKDMKPSVSGGLRRRIMSELAAIDAG